MTAIPAVSREYLYLPNIKAFDPASPDAAVDPTTLPVAVAFTHNRLQPDLPTTWYAAEWVNTTTARILIGPTTPVVLTVGSYLVWLRVTGATEGPARAVGTIEVT